ncbi:MAG: GNAT family N-acetyltransferase [Rhodospirillaceae bacterium]|nr:GNAT family N-acetyltransferase [Rhodospirillaceae bacterium]
MGVHPLGRPVWSALTTRQGAFAAGDVRALRFAADVSRLLAMAGERSRPEGFTEVSGICTRPDARGRGYARKLSAWVAHKIATRGETPFLHSPTTNTNTIRLYESLGFTPWCEVTGVVLRTS